MHTANITLAKIGEAIIAGQEPPFRAHLGSSVIGHDCARKLWYDFRWTKAEAFDARMLRLFNRGHLEEKRFVGFLRAAGIEIWEAGESGDMKSQMRISGHDEHFGGTPDAIGRGMAELGHNVPFLCEFKTHNAKSFAKLQNDGIMKTKWQHFVQMQLLMGGLGLEWALYCAVNKDTDELLMELVRYNETERKRAFDRAGAIIWAKEPPARIGKNPAHFGCKFCHLNRLCYFGDVEPDRNCRSCQWSEPSKDGSGHWLCNMHAVLLDEGMQRKGCGNYQVNPQLHQST